MDIEFEITDCLRTLRDYLRDYPKGMPPKVMEEFNRVTKRVTRLIVQNRGDIVIDLQQMIEELAEDG